MNRRDSLHIVPLLVAPMKPGYFLFVSVFLLPHFVYAGVVVNEIAWMGTAPKEGESTSAAANNEWIELYNSGDEEVSLEGWRIIADDGIPDIPLSGSIFGKGYFLLERANDDVIVSIPADIVYSYKNNALSNSGEHLFLKNGSGVLADEVDMSGGWSAGDNDTKETMQKNKNGIWITAEGTPRSPNAGVSIVPPPSLLPPPDGEKKEQSNGGSQSALPVLFPEIYADAGRDVIAAVGSEIKFIGAALGIKKEPLENARFLWNFGDGEAKDGKIVTHIWRVPGTYQVGLHVASGGYAASDYTAIDIRPNKVEIKDVLYGSEGYIRLRNSSLFDIDIGGWAIEDASGHVFIVPLHTKVGQESEIGLSNETTGLLQNTPHLFLVVRYPNGKQAFEYGPHNEVLSLQITPTLLESKETKETPPSPDQSIVFSGQSPDKAVQEIAAKDETFELSAPLDENAEKKDVIREFAFSAASASPRLFFLGAFAISILSAIGFLVIRTLY